MKFTKFIKPELEYIKENANFTAEKRRGFSLFSAVVFHKSKYLQKKIYH